MASKGNFPLVDPSLNLNFAKTKQLDPRITFARNSIGTYFNQSGVMQTAVANTARFDHDPVTGESLGLLVEEQRTNLLNYSEQFDDIYWTKLRATISANATTAPDGTLTADKGVEDTSLNTHIPFRRTFTTTAATTYTFSIYVKAAERSAFMLLVFNGNTTLYQSVDFDLTGSTAVTRSASLNGSSSIVSVGNGWYRCTLTWIDNAGGISAYVDMRLSDAAISLAVTGNSYTGDGTSGIYLWGAQLEVGAFPTSYIPTVASQVTRIADTAVMSGTNSSSWYRDAEGAFAVEARVYKSNTPAIKMIVGVDTNYALYQVQNTTDLRSYDGTTITYTVNSISDNSAFKAAMAYSVAEGRSVCLDGGAIGTGTYDGNFGSGLYIGCRSTGLNQLNGTIKRLSYYPQRLTNAQLQALTS